MPQQVKLVLLDTTPGEQGVAPGLSSVGGQPLICTWLQALRHCARLLPLLDKVYIVTSPATHGHYLQWASDRAASLGGFPASNLLQHKAWTGQSCPLQELEFALGEVPSLQDSVVVVASGAYFFGLDIPLQRIVEHTVIRGKDTLISCVLPPGYSMEPHSQVEVGGPPESNPRVASLDLQPQGAADGVTTIAAAPMAVLTPATLSSVSEVARQSAGLPSGKQLAALFSHVLASHRPVYSLPIDMFVECSSEFGHLYTSLFVDYYLAEMEAAQSRGPAAQALAVVTASAQETGAISHGYEEVVRMLESVPPSKALWLNFDVMAEQRVAEAQRPAQASKARFGPRELPARLADASLRRHNPKMQHPVYETSANEYGRRAPSQLDLPDVYAGSTGSFTKTFAGPYKARGLNTAITRSKAHALLDDF